MGASTDRAATAEKRLDAIEAALSAFPCGGPLHAPLTHPAMPASHAAMNAKPYYAILLCLWTTVQGLVRRIRWQSIWQSWRRSRVPCWQPSRREMRCPQTQLTMFGSDSTVTPLLPCAPWRVCLGPNLVDSSVARPIQPACA